MRELSELEMQNEEFLANKGISFTTVMMTNNILSHSIFDANRQIVKYLKEQGLHDYALQKNGKDERVMIKTHILTFTEDVLSKYHYTKLAQEETNECGLVQLYCLMLMIMIYLLL